VVLPATQLPKYRHLTQLINGDPYDPELIDVWSCGITLYSMIYGRLPFDEKNKDRLYDKILECKYSLPSGPSSGLLRMIKRIFVREAHKRIRLDEIMKDPWFIGKSTEISTISDFEYEVKIGR
jgi:serine/threonine protein kinase